MKLIFLDIDGVLITRDTFTRSDKAPGPAQGWPPCVEQLNRIVSQTEARICISSTHRGSRKKQCLECQRKLQSWGVRGIFVGCTPNLKFSRNSNSVSRGEEIQEFLDSMKLFVAEIENFVILDDDSDMEHLSDHLVQSEFTKGLTTELADAAIAFLNRT